MESISLLREVADVLENKIFDLQEEIFYLESVNLSLTMELQYYKDKYGEKKE